MKRKAGFVMIALAAMVAVTACDDDDDPDEIEFVTNLSGDNERPTPVDTDATGTARVVDNGGLTMSYRVTVSGIQNVTAAHIHVGSSAVPGPIAVNLNPNTSVTTGVLAEGEFDASDILALQQGASPITMDSLRVLLRAGLTYVNVHTVANPGGEIRGQLLRN